MSSNKTSNLNLHSWVRTDPFSMDEFNENFNAIDKAVGDNAAALEGKVDNDALGGVKSTLENALAKKADSTTVSSLAQYATKIYKGSYVGKGTVGSANPNSITFPFTPKLVIIDPSSRGSFGTAGVGQIFLFWGTAKQYYYSNVRGYVTYDDKTNKMTWYADSTYAADTGYQFNNLNQTYNYIAIG